jgi:hypothetical protein
MLSRARTALAAPVPDEVFAALCSHRSWRFVLKSLDRRFPTGGTSGQGTPATLAARASRGDLAATWREMGLGLTRRVGRLVRTGRSERTVPGVDPDDPGSLRFRAGDDQDREAYLGSVRDQT